MLVGCNVSREIGHNACTRQRMIALFCVAYLYHIRIQLMSIIIIIIITIVIVMTMIIYQHHCKSIEYCLRAQIAPGPFGSSWPPPSFRSRSTPATAKRYLRPVFNLDKSGGKIHLEKMRKVFTEKFNLEELAQTLGYLTFQRAFRSENEQRFCDLSAKGRSACRPCSRPRLYIYIYIYIYITHIYIYIFVYIYI